MPYSDAIRTKIEKEGYEVTEERLGGLYRVRATKGDHTHVALAENLTVAFLEVERSIREAS